MFVTKEQKWIKLNKNGHKYEVLSKDCQTMLFDENAYCVADRIKEISADFYRVSFVYKPYKAQQVAEIWNKLSTIKTNNVGNIDAPKL